MDEVRGLNQTGGLHSDMLVSLLLMFRQLGISQ